MVFSRSYYVSIDYRKLNIYSHKLFKSLEIIESYTHGGYEIGRYSQLLTYFYYQTIAPFYDGLRWFASVQLDGVTLLDVNDLASNNTVMITDVFSISTF